MASGFDSISPTGAHIFHCSLEFKMISGFPCPEFGSESLNATCLSSMFHHCTFEECYPFSGARYQGVLALSVLRRVYPLSGGVSFSGLAPVGKPAPRGGLKRLWC